MIEPCIDQIGGIELGIDQPRVLEIGAGEIGRLEIGALEIGEAEIGLLQPRIFEIERAAIARPQSALAPIQCKPLQIGNHPGIVLPPSIPEDRTAPDDIGMPVFCTVAARRRFGFVVLRPSRRPLRQMARVTLTRHRTLGSEAGPGRIEETA